MKENGPIIRRATPDDASGIAAIYSRYVSETTVSFELIPPSVSEMRRRIIDISSSHPYLVALTPDGDVAGYCYAHPWKERPAYSRTWETTIYLDMDSTGKGLGRELMSRLITQCRQLGCHALIACITAENTGSITFHSSLGFTKVSHFHQVGHKFGRYLDVIDMELIL